MNPTPSLNKELTCTKRTMMSIDKIGFWVLKRCWVNKKVFILLCLFIISRIIFINPLPVFFDSPEYLSRLSNPNLFQAIASGHIPFHISYILLFWPIFQIFSFLHTYPSFMVVVAQVLFSAITMYFFYSFVKMFTNKNIAFYTTLLGISLPLYWITNVSIMSESTSVNFFLLSLFSLTSYAKKKSYSAFYLFIGSIFFGLSLLAHPLALLWTPFLLSIIYLLKKEKIFTVLFALIFTTSLSILINGFFVSVYLHLPFLDGINKYLIGENNLLPDISSFLGILRFFRNGFIPILQNNTIILFILAIISLIKIFKINRKLFVVALLWIFPSLIVNQWFNPLLSGRHGVIAEFGFAFLAATFLEKRRILFFIILTYLLITYLPALALLKQPIPYLTERKFVQTLPKGLLIESHFARPQLEGNYSGKIVLVNQPGWSKTELKETIDSYLNTKRPIFITSQALSDPYGLYSGPFLLPLSLSYANKFELQDVIPNYSLKKFATIDKDAGLSIYKIVAKQTSKYPNIPLLKYNRRRIDYFDPVNRLLFLIESPRIIQSQSIIKE